MSRIVTILQECLPQYRIAFFEGLRDELAKSGVELRLLVGRASGRYAQRGDTREVPWGIQVPQWNWSVGKHDLVWQFPGKHLRGSDLVIVPDQIRQVASLLLWLQQQLGVRKVAYYGHGRDFSKDPGVWSERLKRFISRRVHWWFSYNRLSACVVQAFGFPTSRTTLVINATDTRPLKAALSNLQEGDLQALREGLGLQGRHVGIYIGALAPIKGLPFLLEACQVIRSRVPDFEMIMIGAGPEAWRVREFAAQHPWFHLHPACFDAEKAPYLACADLFLMPIGVGLGVLDTFVAGCPLVTSDHTGHGPEIDYLEHGFNGWVIGNRPTPEAFGIGVVQLFNDRDLTKRLQAGCTLSSENYTMERMVSAFKEGILLALDASSE